MPTISYKSAVIAAFLMLSLAAVGGVLLNAHIGASTAVMKLSSEIVQSLGERVVQRATHAVDTIESYLYVNAEVAADSADILADQGRLLRVFWQQLIHSPAVRAVYIADPSGNMVQVDQDPRLATRVVDRSPSSVGEQLVYRAPDFEAIAHASRPTQYDPRTRPWYQVAETGRVHWSEVYRYAFSQGQGDTLSQGVTASLAVTDPEGQLRYVVAADVTLQGMSDFLSSQPIAEDVAIFVVDDQDRLVAYPYQLNLDPATNTGDGPLPRVQELQQDWIQDAYANYTESGRKTGEPLITHTDGDTYITTATRFEARVKSKWRLIVIAPKAYLLSSANQILRESLVTSVIILLIALFLIYSVATYLSGPILQLAANSRLIEKFQFDEVTHCAHRWTEVGELDDSLRRIGTKLRSLAKFVPAELVSQWLHGDKDLDLDTEVRDLDLLFSGIDDPTRVLANQDPAQLDEWLPPHLDSLAATIHDQRGTIERFTGDGLRAFWGAPTALEGGARRACRSALLAIEANPIEANHKAVTNGRHDEGRADTSPVRTRIAIHSGPALVGNFGSQQRLTYTAVGEAVSTGAALLPLNQRYGTRIIISQSTHEQVKEHFLCRPLDVVRLDTNPGASPNSGSGSSSGSGSGSGPALPLFELVADRTTQPPLDHRLFIDAYTLAFERYLRRDWEDALRHLDSIPEAYRDDRSVQRLSARCRGLLDGSLPLPPKDWDGVYPSTVRDPADV